MSALPIPLSPSRERGERARGVVPGSGVGWHGAKATHAPWRAARGAWLPPGRTTRASSPSPGPPLCSRPTPAPAAHTCPARRRTPSPMNTDTPCTGRCRPSPTPTPPHQVIQGSSTVQTKAGRNWRCCDPRNGGPTASLNRACYIVPPVARGRLHVAASLPGYGWAQGGKKVTASTPGSPRGRICTYY